MTQIYSQKTKEQFEQSFRHHVISQPRSLVRKIMFFPAWSYREKYFGEYKKNRFWLGYKKTPTLSAVVMTGEVVDLGDKICIKLKYKISSLIQKWLALICSVFYLIGLLSNIKNPNFLIFAPVFLLFVVLDYGAIIALYALVDRLFAKGKIKKALLEEYIQKHII